jgi:hypothetical protein
MPSHGKRAFVILPTGPCRIAATQCHSTCHHSMLQAVHLAHGAAAAGCSTAVLTAYCTCATPSFFKTIPLSLHITLLSLLPHSYSLQRCASALQPKKPQKHKHIITPKHLCLASATHLGCFLQKEGDVPKGSTWIKLYLQINKQPASTL